MQSCNAFMNMHGNEYPNNMRPPWVVVLSRTKPSTIFLATNTFTDTRGYISPKKSGGCPEVRRWPRGGKQWLWTHKPRSFSIEKKNHKKSRMCQTERNKFEFLWKLNWTPIIAESVANKRVRVRISNSNCLVFNVTSFCQSKLIKNLKLLFNWVVKADEWEELGGSWVANITTQAPGTSNSLLPLISHRWATFCSLHWPLTQLGGGISQGNEKNLLSQLWMSCSMVLVLVPCISKQTRLVTFIIFDEFHIRQFPSIVLSAPDYRWKSAPFSRQRTWSSACARWPEPSVTQALRWANSRHVRRTKVCVLEAGKCEGIGLGSVLGARTHHLWGDSSTVDEHKGEGLAGDVTLGGFRHRSVLFSFAQNLWATADGKRSKGRLRRDLWEEDSVDICIPSPPIMFI